MRKLPPLLTLALLAACSDAPAMGVPELTDEWALELVSSAEAQEVLGLQADFRARLLQAREAVGPEALSELLHRDEEGFALLVFGSREEARSHEAALLEAHARLNARFPDLQSVTVEALPPAGPVAVVGFGPVESRGDILEAYPLVDPNTCGGYWQQAKLLICAGGCSFTGPAAWICGWGCWCGLCKENSAVADFIC